MVKNGWKSAEIYNALKHGSKKITNMDPFHDIDSLIGGNPTTVKTNLDAVSQLDQEELDSFRSQRDIDKDHKDKEETWKPEDHHTSAFNVFDNYDEEQSL